MSVLLYFRYDFLAVTTKFKMDGEKSDQKNTLDSSTCSKVSQQTVTDNVSESAAGVGVPLDATNDQLTETLKNETDEEMITDVKQPVKEAASLDAALQSCSIKDTVDIVRDTLLDRVAKSDGHFKHQQRDEPDLTFDEKRAIAADLLSNKPSVFLNRFSKYLTVEDIPYFTSMRDDYIIDFYMKEIEKQCDDLKSKTKVRNRRYEAMKQMLEKGNYFSDEEMKARDPLLYEQMVGQYLTPDDVQDLIDKSDLRLSTILEKHMDIVQNNMIYAIQKEIEVCGTS